MPLDNFSPNYRCIPQLVVSTKTNGLPRDLFSKTHKTINFLLLSLISKDYIRTSQLSPSNLIVKFDMLLSTVTNVSAATYIILVGKLNYPFNALEDSSDILYAITHHLHYHIVSAGTNKNNAIYQNQCNVSQITYNLLIFLTKVPSNVL